MVNFSLLYLTCIFTWYSNDNDVTIDGYYLLYVI